MKEYEQGRHAKENEPSKGRGTFDLIIIVVIAIAITFLVRTFVVATYKIPSQSMTDTIQVNDRVFSEKVTYYFNDVQPGDIVTFMNPDGSGETLIKRVIAVGGQTVDLRGGHVYVDGARLDEPYTEGKPSEPLETQLAGVTVEYPYTVPEGYIWVMGDNRTNSKDSRYFGAVSEESVTGRACYTYWPLSNMGQLE
jgi:signal peptidase I